MQNRKQAYSITLNGNMVEMVDGWADLFASTRSGVINNILKYYVTNVGSYPPPPPHHIASGDVATERASYGNL